MTLQECKDKVAEKHGLTNWGNACFVWAGFVKQMEPLMDEAAELYAQQRVEEATRWIPVSERLPEFGSLCLAFGVGHTPVMCRYTRRFERHIDRVDNDRTLAIYYDQITHWQPLPKAPTV